MPRILGIDPGMRSTGWGVVEWEHRSGSVTIVDAGAFVTSPTPGVDEFEDAEVRTRDVIRAINALAMRATAAEVVIEGFSDQGHRRKGYSHRWKTAMAIGGLVAWASDRGLPVTWHDSSVVASHKGAMYDYVELWKQGKTGLIPGDHLLMRLTESEKAHAFDAVAHAAYHAFSLREELSIARRSL